MYPFGPATRPDDVGPERITPAAAESADALKTLVAALGNAGVNRRLLRTLETVAHDCERIARVQMGANTEALNSALSSRSAMSDATAALARDARKR